MEYETKGECGNRVRDPARLMRPDEWIIERAGTSEATCVILNDHDRFHPSSAGVYMSAAELREFSAALARAAEYAEGLTGPLEDGA